MEIDRRTVLKGLVASCLLPMNTVCASEQPMLVGAAMKDGRYGVAFLDHRLALANWIDLPGRGHGFAVNIATDTCVAFARRPGMFARVIRMSSGEVLHDIEATEGRHFYGHGAFSSDGRYLYATENAYEEERGVVGVYDRHSNFSRIGEFATHGIGPHELILLKDGQTLAVANGGILTHPDYPRQKLNLSTMAPSLAYIDSQSGMLFEKVSLTPALHQVSLRHISEAPDGTVWIGGQYQGHLADKVDLVFSHKRGKDLMALDTDDAGLAQYVGSIIAGQNGVAFSSPRGNKLISRGQNMLEQEMEDVCGLAIHEGKLFASTGRGVIGQVGGLNRYYKDLAWDNHLSAL